MEFRAPLSARSTLQVLMCAQARDARQRFLSWDVRAANNERIISVQATRRRKYGESCSLCAAHALLAIPRSRKAASLARTPTAGLPGAGLGSSRGVELLQSD